MESTIFRKKEIELFFNKYKEKPIRGIHLRPNDLTLQIIPTNFNTIEALTGISRQEVYRRLLLAATVDSHSKYAISPYHHEITFRETTEGKPGQVAVWIRITPEGRANNWFLLKLIDFYQTENFCLGLVPGHVRIFGKWLENKVFYPGAITNIFLNKKGKHLRMKIDIPYLHEIINKQVPFILEPEESLVTEGNLLTIEPSTLELF